MQVRDGASSDLASYQPLRVSLARAGGFSGRGFCQDIDDDVVLSEFEIQEATPDEALPLTKPASANVEAGAWAGSSREPLCGRQQRSVLDGDDDSDEGGACGDGSDLEGEPLAIGLPRSTGRLGTAKRRGPAAALGVFAATAALASAALLWGSGATVRLGRGGAPAAAAGEAAGSGEMLGEGGPAQGLAAGVWGAESAPFARAGSDGVEQETRFFSVDPARLRGGHANASMSPAAAWSSFMRIGEDRDLASAGRGRHDSGEASLLCFVVMRPSGEERALMTEQLRLGAGIFACDDRALYCSERVRLSAGNLQVETIQIQTAFNARVGSATDLTASWVNTETFLEAWSHIFASGRFTHHDWVAKVDPDTVFLPNRLRPQLTRLARPWVKGIPPCLAPPACPPEWWANKYDGGFFCRDNSACSGSPFQWCRSQCYSGTPAVALKEWESRRSADLYGEKEAFEPSDPDEDEFGRRNGVPPCTEETPCPSSFSSGSGGYYCVPTRGCKEGAGGAFSASECSKQCYTGEPPELTPRRFRGGGQALYLKNCPDGFGFMGSLEAVTVGAAMAFGRDGGRCLTELDLARLGEDRFLKKCLELLGVQYLEAPEVLSDRYCGNPPPGCASGAVAFHPFKTVQAFGECFDEVRRRDEDRR